MKGVACGGHRKAWVALACWAALLFAFPASGDAPVSPPQSIKVWVPGIRHLELTRTPTGALEYTVEYKSGRRRVLTPDQLAEAMLTAEVGQPWWQKLLNISSPLGVAWVALGLLGQLLFTGRMIVQWLASERSQRSVVPVAFWWMSLGGASMLLVYFIWRKDVVGVLGQSAGWFIYSRNLYFIYRRSKQASLT